jgi:hypothetical protein
VRSDGSVAHQRKPNADGTGRVMRRRHPKRKRITGLFAGSRPASLAVRIRQRIVFMPPDALGGNECRNSARLCPSVGLERVPGMLPVVKCAQRLRLTFLRGMGWHIVAVMRWPGWPAEDRRFRRPYPRNATRRANAHWHFLQLAARDGSPRLETRQAPGASGFRVRWRCKAGRLPGEERP